MTALENVMVGQTVNLKTNVIDSVFHTPRYHREEKKAIEKGLEVIDYVGLSGMGDWMATSMPYGAQRRLEIARAIASDPKLILLDEPTAGMNPQETVEMIDLIRRLRDDLGITVLMIEHDMKVIMEISEQISVIDFGQKIAEGVPEEIQNNKRVIEAYLGPGAAALSEKFQKERKEKSNGK
jgi:branched-chain amino acid transport system ATP-binding protein